MLKHTTSEEKRCLPDIFTSPLEPTWFCLLPSSKGRGSRYQASVNSWYINLHPLTPSPYLDPITNKE